MTLTLCDVCEDAIEEAACLHLVEDLCVSCALHACRECRQDRADAESEQLAIDQWKREF